MISRLTWLLLALLVAGLLAGAAFVLAGVATFWESEDGW